MSNFLEMFTLEELAGQCDTRIRTRSFQATLEGSVLPLLQDSPIPWKVTRGDSIHVAWNFDLNTHLQKSAPRVQKAEIVLPRLRSGILNNFQSSALIGAAYHEASHLLYTESGGKFEAIDALLAKYPEAAEAVLKAPRQALQMHNLIEDVHIEHRLVQDIPHTFRRLADLRSLMARYNSREGAEGAPPEEPNVLTVALFYAQYVALDYNLHDDVQYWAGRRAELGEEKWEKVLRIFDTIDLSLWSPRTLPEEACQVHPAFEATLQVFTALEEELQSSAEATEGEGWQEGLASLSDGMLEALEELYEKASAEEMIRGDLATKTTQSAGAIMARARRQAVPITAALRTKMKALRTVPAVHGIRTGRKLSGRNLTNTVASLRAFEPPTTAFVAPARDIETAFSCVVMVDCSGSMAGDLIQHAVDGALALSHAAEQAGGTVIIAGYDGTREHGRFQIVKTAQATTQAASTLVSALDAQGGTPTHLAVGLGIEILQHRSSDRNRLLFVMTDGMPDSVVLMKEGLDKALESRIVPFVVGIGNGASGIEGRIGHDHVIHCEPADLGKRLAKELQGALR